MVRRIDPLLYFINIVFQVMCAFETAVKNNNEQLIMEQQLAALVSNLCNSVLLYEVMRTRTTDAVANDAAFVQV